VRSFANHRLPTSIVTALVNASNMSLSLNTWSSYGTAERHLLRFEQDTGVKIRFPMNDCMILGFVGWLRVKRKVSAVSIKQYMSGVRTVHLKHGVFPGNLKPDILDSIIRGMEHEDALKVKVPRLAMVTSVMKLLKYALTNSSIPHDIKRGLWAVSTMAFRGSFRIHEILSKHGQSYDPTTTLLGCDVRIEEHVIDGVKETVMKIFLKNPKEDKLCQGVTVELFGTGTFSCPVAAWRKWRQVARVPLAPTKPVFRLGDGSCMTGNMLNKYLKQVLGKYINYDEKKYLSHSFRAGLRDAYFSVF
jgi:hypothetical protein